MIEPSNVLKNFLSYSLAEVDNAKNDAIKKGFRVIDLGVGDPKNLYEGAVEGLKIGAEKYKNTGYPPYSGIKELRTVVSEWFKKRFGLEVNADEQVIITNGSKEAIFHFPMAFLNPGDYALVPSIGYPPYKAGVMFAGGKPIYYDLKEENGFLPELERIEEIFNKFKPKLMWINYPNNPTTVIAKKEFYSKLINLARDHDVIIASDEAYIEIYDEEKPSSILEASKSWDNVVAFHSLSKRSGTTGLRIGFVVGGENLIRYFTALKTQMDSGIANPIQEAAIHALLDENHVEENRRIYNRRRRILSEALKKKGFKTYSLSSIYVWTKISQDSVSFVKRLLEIDRQRKIGINATPGKYLVLKEGSDEADEFVRFSLTASDNEISLASQIIEENL